MPDGFPDGQVQHGAHEKRVAVISGGAGEGRAGDRVHVDAVEHVNTNPPGVARPTAHRGAVHGFLRVAPGYVLGPFQIRRQHRGGPITPSLFLQAKSRKVPTRTRRLTFFFYDQKAVHVVVNSPTTVAQLTTWVDALSVTQKKGMPLTEIEKWNKYGDLVYEEDAAFETLF